MTLLGLIICSLIITSAAPFGSHEIHGFGWRLIFWGLVVLMSSNIGIVCSVIANHWVGIRRPLLNDLIIVALVMLMISPLIWALSISLAGHGAQFTPGFSTLLQYVAVVATGACVLRRVAPEFGVPEYITAKQVIQTAPPRLVRRLPPEARGEILRLTVCDHFVDVVTAETVLSIRMRFADAINEMDTVVGFCTHRSHWVVRDAIAGVEREAGKIHLRLSNGDLVPVSRKYKPGLEQAGVLQLPSNGALAPKSAAAR